MPGRRSIALVLAAVLGAVCAPVAIAARPDRAPTPPTEVVLPPGAACEHAISIESTAMKMRSTTYAPSPGGTIRMADRGFSAARVVDLTTGASVDVKGGGAITVRLLPDGSAEADGTGTLIVGYGPGDSSQLGAGVFLVHGHARESYGPDGSLAAATFEGAATNLCRVLGG